MTLTYEGKGLLAAIGISVVLYIVLIYLVIAAVTS